MEYYDIRTRARKLKAINIIIGGRGIGKTYSALSFMLEQEAPFIYLRNTAVQMDESCSVFGNPFKRLNKDLDKDIIMEAEKKHYLIWDKTEDKKLIGYGAALSTFNNLRGVDLSDVQYVVFDEFIERRRLSFDQFQAFAGFYETVNRNRELSGEDPLKVILLSNSQTLKNDILAAYGLTQKIVNMINNGETSYSTQDIYLELPRSEISEAKRNTANYRLISGTAAAREALENEFTADSFRNIAKLPKNEMQPVCMLRTEAGSVAIWKHKSRPLRYCCSWPDMNCKLYDMHDHKLFFREQGLLLREYAIRGKLFFENYEVKLILDSVLDI